MFMVAILCPHCEGEIELDDDLSGEFQCPLCDGEFEWNIPDDDSPIADPGSRKFAAMYAWLLNKASLGVTPVPLMRALFLLPFSLLAGVVMIIVSANFFILGSSLGSLIMEVLTDSGSSEAAGAGGIVIIPIALLAILIALLAFLIAILFGLFGLAIIVSAIVRLIRR